MFKWLNTVNIFTIERAVSVCPSEAMVRSWEKYIIMDLNSRLSTLWTNTLTTAPFNRFLEFGNHCKYTDSPRCSGAPDDLSWQIRLSG